MTKALCVRRFSLPSSDQGSFSQESAPSPSCWSTARRTGHSGRCWSACCERLTPDGLELGKFGRRPHYVSAGMDGCGRGLRAVGTLVAEPDAERVCDAIRGRQAELAKLIGVGTRVGERVLT